MNPQTIDVLGQNAHVTQGGAGRPILLAHGFPLDHQMWNAQFEPLSQQFHVICPDLPGFGNSQPSWPKTEAAVPPLTMPTLADWLAALLDAIGIDEPVVFCGLSMGGYIGWEFARRHPQRLAALVACNTRASDDTETIRRGRQLAAREVLRSGAGPVAESLVPKLFAAPDASNEINPRDEERKLIRQVIVETDPDSIAAGQLGMAQRENARQWLERITAPTLLVAGEFDEIVPAEEMEQDSSYIPDSEFVCLNHAGHLAPLESPQAFNDAVVDWLNRKSHG